MAMLKGRLNNIKNDVELALLNVEGIGKFEISCPKCHGEGEYYVPTNDIREATFNFQPKKCLICKGIGKVTVDAYEDYQERCRQ